jgi:3,4-dihydroxy 2-butanone 4-phosphate synthase/GTP cyclohydrolase II
MKPLATVESAIVELAAGRPVVLVDDEQRENEGDLVVAAEHVTPEAITFMAREARGLICAPIVGRRLDELDIPLMVAANGTCHATAFTVSVDACRRVSTGISAADRCETIRQLLDPRACAADFARPGHVFPLRYREGGVLARPGHTEASVDLAKLAGLYPAAVICEVMNDDGSMARLPDLLRFGRRHGIAVASIAALIDHRLGRGEGLGTLATAAGLRG